MATRSTAAKKPAAKKAAAPRVSRAKKETLPEDEPQPDVDPLEEPTPDLGDDEPTAAKVNPHVTALKPNGAWWEGLSNTPNRAKLSR